MHAAGDRLCNNNTTSDTQPARAEQQEGAGRKNTAPANPPGKQAAFDADTHKALAFAAGKPIGEALDGGQFNCNS